MGITPNRGIGKSHRPLLQRDIERAMANSRSNSEAARYLNVNIETYKKYAKMYGLYDQHRNRGGKGQPRPKMRGAWGLESILAGEHPTYPHRRLKARLIAAGRKAETCDLCGFNRKREVDGRSPICLYCLDGNNQNLQFDNLQFRCYNCVFLTTGVVRPRAEVTTEMADFDMMASGELSIDDIRQMQEQFFEEQVEDDDNASGI
jgi:hypothetical protein